MGHIFPRVLYCAGFNKEIDKENFCREQLMLYLPWRNYEDILGDYLTYEARYNDKVKNCFKKKRKNYVCAQTENIAQPEEFFSAVNEDEAIVTHSQHQEGQDLYCPQVLDALIQEFLMGVYYDLALDLNVGRKQIDF
jgi:hypothetical protein